MLALAQSSRLVPGLPVAAALETAGYPAERQFRLVGQYATKTAVESRLRRLRKQVKKGDTVVVFWAGHGYVAGGRGRLACWDTLPDDLLGAIRVLADGDALIAPKVTRRLIQEFARRPEPPAASLAPVEGLTERELEVLHHVAKGLSNAEIAEELIMSPATAKTHVSHLLTKLGARDRTQLVMIAYETGVAVPGA